MSINQDVCVSCHVFLRIDIVFWELMTITVCDSLTLVDINVGFCILKYTFDNAQSVCFYLFYCNWVSVGQLTPEELENWSFCLLNDCSHERYILSIVSLAVVSIGACHWCGSLQTCFYVGWIWLIHQPMVMELAQLLPLLHIQFSSMVTCSTCCC